MASSQAILRGDHDDNKATILSLFAVQQAALRDKQAQMLRIMQQLEELEEEKEHSERERNFLAVMVARLMWRERCVWTYARPESWFETTLPHLPETAHDDDLGDMPLTPIICMKGPGLFEAEMFTVCVDGVALLATQRAAALKVMFLLYFVLNIEYPPEVALTLKSLQRYAANKACIRNVAGRFEVSESTHHTMMSRVTSFLLDIAPNIIKFPSDLQKLAKDFEQVTML
ncbi:hypothetical protein HPB52_008894 [Rhipicephalus sanguineus]|uniref:Uncharacterized protein n=1 Tax=Rhipicephalus sanguineus TaxID=34632 RepID=A0A9D4SMM4_RHISA|nr:hypothetical protein HPB52_008894 [Rhipicephalus sanguineus]